MNVKDIVASNVQRIFLAKGYKIKPFADAHGIPYGNVYRVLNPETSNPTLKNIESVADALKVPAWTLFIPSGDKFNKIANLYSSCSDESKLMIECQLEALAERDILKSKI